MITTVMQSDESQSEKNTVAPKILVVEDEGIVAENIRECLLGSGFAVLGPVKSGEEAIQICSSCSVDLALMDIQLAGQITGIEAADKIQTRYSVPIVFLTAYSDPETVLSAEKLVPYGYVVKPFSGRELEITIRMALANASVTQERDRLLDELRTTLAHVRRLQGLLPICAHCKRIRDDQGYWKSVESYLGDQLHTSFSHSICPKCSDQYFAFLSQSNRKNREED